MRSSTVAVLVALAAGAAACNQAAAGAEHHAPPPPAPAPVPPLARCPLAINEVAPAGKPHDWFELVNVSDRPVDLSAYAFTDGQRGPTQAAALPATVLAPGARHVQEVTERTTGFRLGSDDALRLYLRGAALPCDQVRWDLDDAPTGTSFGRLPDGVGRFVTAEPDSRGVPNR